MTDLGIVAIGRNEGDRLRRCLNSLVGGGLPIVYVDGNSTDGSVELARSLGVEVVKEDPTRSNCAATARNEGFERLLQVAPDVRFVQFVDADCEVVDGWLDRGRQFLQEHPGVALVAGRRRERYPERSIYNRLADVEWDLPIGEIDLSHGDMMVRVDAFRRIGGFDPKAFVAEDHDFCMRLRQAGYSLMRIDAEMTLHDIAITRFKQWFYRCVRSGYGFPLMALMHGRSQGKYCVRHVLSALFWAVALPLLILALALALPWPFRGLSLLLLLAYPIQILRIFWRHRRRGMEPDLAWHYGWTCTLARFPHALGLFRFGVESLKGRTKTTVRDF
jgi:GT2 family glycosyltransferase